MSLIRTVDVGKTLDQGTWSGYQKAVVALIALTIIFDGIDNQLLGIAIPSIMREWSVARAPFAFVLACGMFGMMVGGAIAGMTGDRLGRKVALLGSVAVFGLLTLAGAFAQSMGALAALRFLAGVGLGGALPNGAALSAEFVPGRHRALAVVIAIVCVPLGGMLAAALADWLLPALGWRGLFVAGGALPLVAAGLLWGVLPESPRFLQRQPSRRRELAAILRRSGHTIDEDAEFVDATEAPVASRSVAELFRKDMRRDTIALWIAFFANLLGVYMAFNWLPALLSGAGLSAISSRGILAFNMGGAVGAVTAALTIGRVGSRVTLLVIAAGAAVCSVILASMPMPGSTAGHVLAMLTVTGALINAAQTSMYALAAHVYPTVIRATGVGSAVAFGRAGGVASTYVGSWALTSGGSVRFFQLIAAAMVVVFVSLAAIRRHIRRIQN